MRNIVKGAALTALLAVLAAFSGCDGTPEPPPTATVTTAPPTENVSVPHTDSETPVNETPANTMEVPPPTEPPVIFEMPMPAATGAEVLGNAKAEIDVSNKSDGYIMIKFLSPTDRKPAVQITGPSGITYQNYLNNKGDYDVFPLSDGNGAYSIKIGESVAGGYTTACTASFTVELKDEFAPFLRPNQYVNYTKDCKTVEKAAELTAGLGGVLDKVGAVYSFVIGNISYDKELAAQISSNIVTEYIPDIDSVLQSGKGICFDYASLMTAMLRSQGIPTKLAIGYAGSVYHAWISVYSEETGWVDGVISFNGEEWQLMDPTFASSGGQSSEVLQYIGNGSNYTVMYLY